MAVSARLRRRFCTLQHSLTAHSAHCTSELLALFPPSSSAHHSVYPPLFSKYLKDSRHKHSLRLENRHAHKVYALTCIGRHTAYRPFFRQTQIFTPMKLCAQILLAVQYLYHHNALRITRLPLAYPPSCLASTLFQERLD